jgi:hypothetical protein
MEKRNVEFDFVCGFGWFGGREAGNVAGFNNGDGFVM